MESCNGYGDCWRSDGDTLVKRTDMTCTHNCKVSKCLNHVVCGQHRLTDYIYPHSIMFSGQLCSSCRNFRCDTSIAGPLRYRYRWQDVTAETCVVCFEQVDRLIEFPTGCGHSFCRNCIRDLFGYNHHEFRFVLSHQSFGCPPCPNGCLHPDEGEQEFCDTCEELYETWSTEHYDQYELWSEMTDRNEADKTRHYNTKICPLCRSKYKI
jgi:hypothetical protein